MTSVVSKTRQLFAIVLLSMLQTAIGQSYVVVSNLLRSRIFVYKDLYLVKFQSLNEGFYDL